MPPKHFKRRHHHGSNNSGFRGTQSSRGLDPNIVVLHPALHGSPSNLPQFSTEMLPKISSEYGALGSIISHGAYKVMVYPQFTRTVPYDPASGEPDFELIRHNAKVNELVKMEMKMDSDKTKVFGTLWGNMSPESRHLVESESTWSDVLRAQDPLALFKLIKSTHTLGETSGVRLIDQERAKREYGSIRQRAGENYIDWYRRLEMVRKSFPLLGLTEPTEQDMVMVYLTRLDPDQFSGFMVDLENSVIMGSGSYPTTMGKATELLRSHKMVGRNGSVIQTAVYATSAASGCYCSSY